MKVLALDHGSGRTGVAVSDPTGTLARPLPAIERVASPDGRRRLAAVVEREDPEIIVVGDPVLLSGAAGSQAAEARRFARGLRRAVNRPVELVDERLSTAEADRRRRESGSRADRDSLAACVLLESYLARANE